MSSCNGCDRRWNGTAEAHCAECHRQFSSVHAFDKHRRDYTCHDPAHLRRKDGNPLLDLGARRDGPIWREWRPDQRPFPQDVA